MSSLSHTLTYSLTNQYYTRNAFKTGGVLTLSKHEYTMELEFSALMPFPIMERIRHCDCKVLRIERIVKLYVHIT